MSGLERVEQNPADGRERAGAHGRDVQPAVDGPASAPRREQAPPALLQLQQLAGNRAVASMMGERRAPIGADEDANLRRDLRTRDVTGAANPFDFRRDPTLSVQRYKTAAGYKKTAVTIESADFTATGVSALWIQKKAARLNIGSGPNPAYTAKGKVTITGDPDEVAQYEVGFLQTVYESNRDFYYANATETSGKGAKKMTDYTKSQPGRDGDTGFEPWYGAETVFPFAKKAADTQSTRMDDTPSSGNPWIQTFGKSTQYLVKTGGKDDFVSWLAVRNKRTKAVTLLNNASWNLDYGADVTVDKKTPANSTVTPSSGKLAVTATGDGAGSKTPIYTDPVANDAAWKTVAW
jgi:hypothetical protein